MGRFRQVVIFLLSVTLIGMELIWTRLFSAELFYSFAFLILSLAIMGLGLGALALRFVRQPLREDALGLVLCLTGLAALAGPPLVFRLGLDFSLLPAGGAMILRLILAIVLLSGAFFFGGMSLAMLFRRYHDEMPRLYMADLVGAGAGVMTAILLMNRLGTPTATFVCSLPVLVAALLSSKRWLKVLPLLLTIGMLVLCYFAVPLLEQERAERGPVIYKHWDSTAKIKIYGFGEEYRSINIDNLANTGTYGFDGNWDRRDDQRFEFGIDVSNLIERFESCVFLSLGAGGGMDVLQALQAGAKEIHAVEVNAHINKLMQEGDPAGYIIPSPEPEWLAARAREEEEEEEKARRDQQGQGEQEGQQEQDEQELTEKGQGEQEVGDKAEEPAQPARQRDEAAGQQRQATTEPEAATVSRNPADGIITMAEFSGYIYRDPRVRVITEDARAYVGRFQNKFDLIYSLSSNSFAALASGSFALAENYLFTTEAFRDYWESLSENGFMMMEHQFYMPRLVASLVDALEGLGVEDPTSHFAVYDLPQLRRNMLLLSRQPLTDALRDNAFGALTEENFERIHLLYPAPEGLQDNLINRILLEGWRSVAPEARVDISPTVDDRPFVGQMGLWRNLSREKAEKLRMMDVFGFPLAKVIIVTVLAVVLVLVLPLNLLPYVVAGDKLRPVPWLYFFVIGAAFMAVEVVLIQQYTLFVGPSAHSIATILLTLLVGSGIGSRLAPRFGDRLPFLGIVVWLLLDVVAFQPLAGSLGGLSMATRILVTALLVAPLGFLMGMPFPKGAMRVRELIDWGFAVNGAASVLGATGILLVAFAFGFSVSLVTVAGLYLLALGLLSASGSWRSTAAIRSDADRNRQVPRAFSSPR